MSATSLKPRISIGTGTCGRDACTDDILATLRSKLDDNGLNADNREGN